MQAPITPPRKRQIGLLFYNVAMVVSVAVAAGSILACINYDIMIAVACIDSAYLVALLIMCFYVQKAQARATQRYEEDWTEFKRQWDHYLHEEQAKNTVFRRFIYTKTHKEDNEGFDIEIKIVNDLGSSEVYPYSFMK